MNDVLARILLICIYLVNVQFDHDNTEDDVLSQ